MRLIGEDLEIRPPRFVPLAIEVALCVDAEFWPEDVRFVLEQEFSEGYTPDGRPGFFHPDHWTFGQALRASEIAGRIHPVAGVEHVISITLKRWNAARAGDRRDIVEVALQRDPPRAQRPRQHGRRLHRLRPAGRPPMSDECLPISARTV